MRPFDPARCAGARAACIGRLLAATAIALGSAGALPARAQTAPPPAGVLSLQATASVEVRRDLVAITFSTAREGVDAQAVQGELKAALDAALAEARKAARPGAVDVSTGGFHLYPRQAPKGGGIAGWQGSAELVVEGRDIAAIGQLAGRLRTLTVSRIAHRLSREAQQKVEGEVAAEAIARFRAKAEAYARHFGYGGATIREVDVQTNEAGGPMPIMRMQAATATADAPLAVEPGKATVTAQVSGSVQMK